MSELELKFQVSDAVVASLRAELRRHGARTVHMMAHYFDTPGFALAEHGVALRLRHEGASWAQTLKAKGTSAVDRLEHNVRLRAQRGAAPQLDLHRHDGTAAAAALHAALADAATSLAAQYTTDFARLVCELQVDGAVIEAAFDQGSIQAHGRAAAICELELEHKSGPTGPLFALAQAWSGYAGLWLNTTSKSARGVLLTQNRPYPAATKAEKPTVDASMSGAQFVRAVVRATLDQVLANASAIAAGSREEGHVHQLRVGLRRLRTALRELAPLDPAVDPMWEAPLKRTFASLGEIRDDVTAARAVAAILEQAHAPKLRWDAKPSVDADAVVKDAPFQRTLIDLIAFALQTPASAETATDNPLRPYLYGRLGRLHARVASAGKTFETLAAQEQHRTRKQLKRLRYLAEFAAPLAHHKDAKRFLAHLEPAQDALGKHMDVVVAIERFRRDAAADRDALFAVGFLEAYQRDTAREARAALKEVAQARPFWN